MVVRLGYGLDDRGSYPGRGFFFFTRYRVQTGSGAHKASCTISTGGSFPRVKRPEREANHSLLVPRLRLRGAVSSLPTGLRS
jgi:hypothetical protein